jgi:hypothetical protein
MPIRYTKAPPSKEKPETFLDRELQRIESSLRNIDADSLTVSNAATFNGGLLLANAKYINWYNAAGVASVVGIGLNGANDFVIRNEGKNSSTLYLQTLDSGGVARNTFAVGVNPAETQVWDRDTNGSPYIAYYTTGGTRVGYLQSSGAIIGMIIANDRASSSVLLRALTAASAVMDLQWLYTAKLMLNAKDTIDASDAYLRLNQSSQYANGIYTPGAFRADGSYFAGASSTWGATGTYGTINMTSAASGYYGVALNNRVIFMHDGVSNAGVYQVVNNHWLFLATLNAELTLYYAGVASIRTQSNKGQVWDGSAWRDMQRGNAFKSSQQAVATSGTVAHGLGKLPESFQVVLVCTTAEKGYSIGDEVDVAGIWTSGGGAEPFNSWCDATNIGWSGKNTTALNIYNKAATTLSAITAASWRIVCKAQTFY